MIKYEKEFANLPDYLPDCAGCTDPNSEGTHSATTKQHWQDIYIKPLLLRQIDEDNKRFLEMIGEDDKPLLKRTIRAQRKIGNHDRIEEAELWIENRNQLRAELRNKVNKK